MMNKGSKVMIDIAFTLEEAKLIVLLIDSFHHTSKCTDDDRRNFINILDKFKYDPNKFTVQ